MGFFKNIVICTAIISAISLMPSCASRADLHSTQDRDMTLGLVQKDLHVGMAQADVAVALGSPNIVTKDSEGDESWVYDKIATEVSQSSSAGFYTLFLFGGAKEKNYAASTQKTLTVVVKFDRDSNVKSVSYHSSKF
jgi:outer membrane protein assembly factor BamE (lipoprotein component of BamABCDE complex)